MIQALISPIDPVMYVTEYFWDAEGQLLERTAPLENAYKVVDTAQVAFPVADTYFWVETETAEPGNSYYDTVTQTIKPIPRPPVPPPTPAADQPNVVGAQTL